MSRSFTAYIVRRKLDPAWPKCRTCREPLSPRDKQTAHWLGGRCRPCAARPRRPCISDSPSFNPYHGLWDELPDEVDLLDL